MKLSRAALRPLLAAHERGALPLVGAAWGVTARNASHRRSPLTRAEPCHWSERRGVSLREMRATMQVMPGVSLRARWDATLVSTTRVREISKKLSKPIKVSPSDRYRCRAEIYPAAKNYPPPVTLPSVLSAVCIAQN